MYSSVQMAFKFIRYWLTSANGKGHGMHSPFAFELIEKVLNDTRHFYAYDEVEQLRKFYLNESVVIPIEDFGAGSKTEKTKERKLKSIAQTSLKPKKFSQLLFRLVHFYQPKKILELGTSLGVTTAYLAKANPSAKIISMEGAQAVAEVAKLSFKKLSLNNIEVVTGNFDETLPFVLSGNSSVDLAFIDGNHRYEPTIRYFNQILNSCNEYSIIILDDIHWSKEMEQAWYEIRQNESVTMTIDLFFIGLVFLRKDFKIKQHFSIRF